MSDQQSALDTVLELTKAWAAVASLATVIVYVLGYLSVRSHYTAFGIDVELGLFDDRYTLAGARFLVFALANLATLAIPLLLFGAAWPVVRRLVPGTELLRRGLPKNGLRLVLLCLLAFAGVTFAQLLQIHDLLLDQSLPGVSPNGKWSNKSLAANALVCWLAAGPEKGGTHLTVTFKALLLLACVTLGWAWGEARQDCPTHRNLAPVLWLLAALTVILLPVYHGIFYADTIVRRLADAPPDVKGAVPPVWVVYRGASKAVLFARDASLGAHLVAINVTALDNQSLVGTDHISRLLEIEGCPTK